MVRVAEATAEAAWGNWHPIPAQLFPPPPLALDAGKVVGEVTPEVAYSPLPPSPAVDVSLSAKPVPALMVLAVDIAQAATRKGDPVKVVPEVAIAVVDPVPVLQVTPELV